MVKHANLSTADREILMRCAVSASRCWLVLSAAAVLAGLAHVFNLV